MSRRTTGGKQGKPGQPDRLRRSDTGNGEAIVESMQKCIEVSRNEIPAYN